MLDPTYLQDDHDGRPHDTLLQARPCIAGATLAVALFPVHPHMFALPPCQPLAIALFPALPLFAPALFLIVPLSPSQLLGVPFPLAIPMLVRFPSQQQPTHQSRMSPTQAVYRALHPLPAACYALVRYVPQLPRRERIPTASQTSLSGAVSALQLIAVQVWKWAPWPQSPAAASIQRHSLLSKLEAFRAEEHTSEL